MSKPSLSLPVLLNAMRWLVYDTFRQALAGRIFWIMLTVSAVCIVFCLGISVESGLADAKGDARELITKTSEPFAGGEGGAGSISFLFGFMHVSHSRNVADAVGFIQVFLASLVAGALGFALTLIWTAGFMPEFLQPQSASVLLAKPIPRWALLVGKFLGVLAFVAFQIAVFFIGTWLALTLKTDVWNYGYLACIPLFVLHFAMIFSFTVLIAVCTRSTVSCIFGSLLFWLMCWGMNVGRHFAVGLDRISEGTASLGAFSGLVVQAGYWLLPKPADVLIIQEHAMQAQRFTTTLSARPEMQAVFDNGAYFPEWSILASCAFAVVVLVISARTLATSEY